jgi:glycosyltransferase involved in cell wall biosynthesis
MNVFLVDPSMFTPPYDFALLQGLESAGARAQLFGRVPRFAGEFETTGNYRAFFYGWSEGRIQASGLRCLKGPAKAAEHIVDMRRFAAECRGRAPDVVHFQWLPLPLVDTLFLDSINKICPTILTVHDSTPFNGDASSSLQLLQTKQCWRKVDHIITHTAAARESIVAQGVSSQRISIIPHGVLRKQGAAPTRTRATSDRLDILFFGQIKPYKGLDVLVEALALLPPQTRKRVRLRIRGKAYMDMSPILSRIESAGLAGLVDAQFERVPDEELDALFAAADVIAMPYRRIDASGVLSKALDHGLAVVASDTGGFSEFLQHGETALLCPIDDAAAFARAIEALVDDRQLLNKLQANARRLGDDTPSWSEIGKQTIDVYRRARGRRAAGTEGVQQANRARRVEVNPE